MASLYTSPGTAVGANIPFNSGQVNVGTSQLIDITDINVKFTKATKPLRILGSIIAAKLSTTDLQVKMTFKTASVNMALLQTFFGSSSSDSGGPNAGTDLLIYDAQEASIPVLNVTLFTGPAQTYPVQYQFLNSVVSSMTQDLKVDAYGDMSGDIEATNVIMVNLSQNQS